MLKNENCKLFSNTVPLVFMYCVKNVSFAQLS